MRKVIPYAITLALGTLLGVGIMLPSSNTPAKVVQATTSYRFDPTPGCGPASPGADAASYSKRSLDCLDSPFRNNPGFITEDQVHVGDTICVHYTTQAGGPKSLSYKIEEGPFPDDSGYSFGDRFNVSPSPYGEGNHLGAAEAGLAMSHSTHFQVFQGWSKENFTTAGPCKSPSTN